MNRKIIAILKFIILIGLLVGLPAYIYFFQHQWIDQVSSIEKVQTLFARYQGRSIGLYLTAQVIQIIICIIPGQWLQIAAGLGWGFWMGYLWSIVGAAIGSVIAYYLARWLGRDAMHLFFGEEKVNKYMKMLNSKRAYLVVFLLFLIPGFPKDLCDYLAGLAEIRLRPFLIMSLVGRTPGMMGSILIGTQVGAQRWEAVIIIAAIFFTLFLLGFIFRKQLMDWFDRAYDRWSR